MSSAETAGDAGADGESSSVGTPAKLHEVFDPSEVQRWDEERFQVVKKLQDATRNRGQVLLMRDAQKDMMLAVKQMPNEWVQEDHSSFLRRHPGSTELPWLDIGCTRHLNSVGYVFSNTLHGVYRDAEHTYVTSSFASDGDLFTWCQGGLDPGPEREFLILPFIKQILSAMQQLHDMQIAHRDISLENILADKAEQLDSSIADTIRIIDFGMATTTRSVQECVRGKPAYQAPEMHTSQENDPFLSDVFSIGVTLYAMAIKDYPWLSTKPGGCKCFEFVQKRGFRAYLEKRKLRNSNTKVADAMSENMKQLLEGMLEMNPADRLTLGEQYWAKVSPGRKSVWEEPWICLRSL